jgi:hypothetical protein
MLYQCPDCHGLFGQDAAKPARRGRPARPTEIVSQQCALCALKQAPGAPSDDELYAIYGPDQGARDPDQETIHYAPDQ